MLDVKESALRVLAGDVTVKRAVPADTSVQNHRDMRYANFRRASNQLDKRKLIHEIMEQFSIFDQLGPRNIERFRLTLLRGGAHLKTGQSQTRDQIATLHD
jgi:hypothetical protein